MSTIIIITPPPTRPQSQSPDPDGVRAAIDPDGFAQELARTSPYDEAADAIAQARAAGQCVRIIET